jgi:hypothetical protein
VSLDPFAELGLPDDASAADVRAARRELAKEHHPDRGGEPRRMQAVNAAAAAALRRIAGNAAGSATPGGTGAPTGRTGGSGRAASSSDHEPRWSGVRTDVPSFTVEALPAESFEALLVVAGWLGEVVDDDPPYRLDTLLAEPDRCWCRLELVPDAGASTVSLTVAPVESGGTAPAVETVRDVWIDGLNRLDWA